MVLNEWLLEYQRKLASTTKNPFILNKLANSKDGETVDRVAHNPHTPVSAMVNIPNDFIQ